MVPCCLQICAASVVRATKVGRTFVVARVNQFRLRNHSCASLCQFRPYLIVTIAARRFRYRRRTRKRKTKTKNKYVQKKRKIKNKNVVEGRGEREREVNNKKTEISRKWSMS